MVFKARPAAWLAHSPCSLFLFHAARTDNAPDETPFRLAAELADLFHRASEEGGVLETQCLAGHPTAFEVVPAP